jgi:uncharacterized protein YcbX
MVGERLQQTTLGVAGVSRDRRWAIRDLELREITSAKRLPALLKCSARFVDHASDHVEIVLPSGQRISSEDADASKALSSALKRNLSLEPLAPSTNRRHYRLGKFRSPRALRKLLGVRSEGPLPDLSVLPLSMLATLSLYATPPGTYFDAFPIHIVTTSALSTLSRAAGGEGRSERFRPNLVIETESSDDGYPELGWKGGLRIGEVELPLVGATFRCGMPAHAQAMHVPKAPSIVRTIYDELGTKFGVYTNVATGGEIAVGDPVFLHPADSRAMDSRWERLTSSMKRRLLDAYIGFGRG